MSDKDIKMSCGVLASDIIKQIDKHDEPIIELLQERCEGFTLIQIANRLKRSCNDVKYSIHRLKLGGHVENWPWYGRVCLVEFDFRKQVYAAHPEDAITKIDDLEETIKHQQAVIDELSDCLDEFDIFQGNDHNYLDSPFCAKVREVLFKHGKIREDERPKLKEHELLSKLNGGEE